MEEKRRDAKLAYVYYMLEPIRDHVVRGLPLKKTELNELLARLLADTHVARRFTEGGLLKSAGIRPQLKEEVREILDEACRNGMISSVVCRRMMRKLEIGGIERVVSRHVLPLLVKVPVDPETKQELEEYARAIVEAHPAVAAALTQALEVINSKGLSRKEKKRRLEIILRITERRLKE